MAKAVPWGVQENKEHIDIDRTTTRSLQIEMFAHFLSFQAHLCPPFGSPMKILL